MKFIIPPPPIILLSTVFAFAEINKGGAKSSTSREEFCQQAKNPNYFKSLFYSRSNLLAFRNQGGLMNGGVCWWHSMMTRTVQYLTVYRPELPKATPEEAQKILNWLIATKGVVEIPGYHNFYEFSSDHASLVMQALNAWQIIDGGLGLGFIRGLSGNHQVTPGELSEMMDSTYKLVKGSKRVAYQKLQVEGITAHAWLVIDMIKTSDGYKLDVVDSNENSVSTVTYIRGMTQLSEYRSVPYTSRNSIDHASYESAISDYCKRGMSAADLDQLQIGN